jgi:hypothetical protein
MSECRYKGSLRCSKVARDVSFAKRGYVEDFDRMPSEVREVAGDVEFCQGWVG